MLRQAGCVLRETGRPDIMKPSNTLISEAMRKEIKACQGTLSLATAAKKFGVSRRSVGRIYHGGELSAARCTC